MSDLFDTLDAPTEAAEGGYSNNPADHGGETNHGITIATARANGYLGPMAAMTAAQAKAIRRSAFYVKPGIELIARLSVRLATEVYDTGINMGAEVAGTFLQRSLNVLNAQGTDFPDLKVDGSVGPTTATALKAFLTRRGVGGEQVLLKALNCLQGARYIELAEGRPANEAFEFGWLANRIGQVA